MKVDASDEQYFDGFTTHNVSLGQNEFESKS